MTHRLIRLTLAVLIPLVAAGSILWPPSGIAGTLGQNPAHQLGSAGAHGAIVGSGLTLQRPDFPVDPIGLSLWDPDSGLSAPRPLLSHLSRLPKKYGVVVFEITAKDGIAAKAGLKKSDVIYDIRGTAIKSGKDLLTWSKSAKPGRYRVLVARPVFDYARKMPDRYSESGTGFGPRVMWRKISLVFTIPPKVKT